MSLLLYISTQNIWMNLFFYLFVLTSILFFYIIQIAMKKMTRNNLEFRETEQQHTAKIDMLRKDHSDTLEKIRNEMLRKEEERTRQWMESEKETLHVLNGVSQLLELGENIGRVESEKILKEIEIIKKLVIENSSIKK